MSISTKPPSGTRDFLPDDIRRREYVVGVIRRVYEKYGYEPLETPAFENLETLLGKYGDEGNKLIFKILKRGEHEHTGEADLALRYDLTVPLARVIAQNQNHLPKFFKRYQIQPVWRADRPARGRFREFYQCDIDSIGSTSPLIEVEQLGAVSDVLRRLGFEDFVIRLNHRGLLMAMLRHWNVPPEQYDTVLVTLDKKDKIGADGVSNELQTRGVAGDVRTRIVNWLGAAYDTDWFPWLKLNVPAYDDAGREAFAQLAQIMDLSQSSTAHGKVRVDFTLARGLSYYTGAIMEITVPDLAGSLGGGGRYDNLIGMFSKRDVPACGFSLGLERILFVMSERGMFPEEITNCAVDIMVTMWPAEDLKAQAIRVADDLRREDLNVEIYPQADKLLKQFEYAEKRRARFVLIIREDEIARHAVKVRHVSTRTEKLFARDSIASVLPRIAREIRSGKAFADLTREKEPIRGITLRDGIDD